MASKGCSETILKADIFSQ
jgi:hypothetical protein